ncbi:MAG TPA: helix-turn-helix transcriptional regulator [Armatimonadota bacterium]|jgi:transcriptional regulator with XRE-family HTH domain
METTFGAFVEARRRAKEITLRKFSALVSMDPANYSRVERGLSAPPTHPDKLLAFANALGVEPEGEEYQEMVRLAAIGGGRIPPRVLSDEEVLRRLPVLFRSLEAGNMDDETLHELFEALKRE